MSIYKIDQNVPTTTKFNTLNDMIIEADGKIEQGIFNKYELDQLFSDLGIDRKFNRGTSLGHTLSNYTNWYHVQSEDGYSIWKYPLSDYKYNANNNVYFDNKELAFRGAAGTETASIFSSVFVRDESGLGSWEDNSTEAGTEVGTQFSMPAATALDYMYLGYSSKFGGAKIEFHTRGSNYTLKFEYWSAAGWVELTSLTNQLTDNTSSFVSDGTITWTIPTTWIPNTVNGEYLYFIRISSSTVPVTVAQFYYLIPYTSVIAILGMSSTQVQNETWAWCSYNSAIYVTIRNTGASAYEGDYFINSGSSTTNKQNYFVSNHEFKIDYETWSYGGLHAAVASGVSVGDMVAITDEYTFDTATASQMTRKAIGVLLASGSVKYMTGVVRNVNTDGTAIVPGNVVYLSTTAGKVSKNAPPANGVNIIQAVGTALTNPSSTNVIDMVMHLDQVPVLQVT